MRKIIMSIVAIIMMLAFSLSAFAATTSYSVASSRNVTKNVSGSTATHYFVKGGVTGADYVAMTRYATDSKEKMAAKMSITSSNGKTTTAAYKNGAATNFSGNYVISFADKSQTKTKGVLWKGTKSTNSTLTVVPVYGATTTWTVTGK